MTQVVHGIERLLIANRGEIAVRIIRTCRNLGIATVLAHSDADRDSLAVRMADRAICVGAAQPAQSYLNMPAILLAATALHVDAVHPGYGFLAENAAFAAACEAGGLVFVGPPASAMRLMGDKTEARRVAAREHVPVVPGSASPVEARDAALLAESLGYPVLVKAAGGGGGRGIRLVHDGAALADVLAGASAEARSAFGDGSVYLEKYLSNARHIEIQIAFDAQGNGVHLGERDCTVQRRYQKLTEESPSIALDDATRADMAEAALRLCRAVGYRNAGTVEFLFDQDSGAFYFIEMNTRLQVEHPVTELVTGLDLVELQLRVAAGEALGIAQDDVRRDGHAIEFRVNSEDPAHDFRPCAGRLERWSPPLGPGVRVDTHCQPGYVVPPFYDSLLAKVVVWGRTREQALARARGALREFDVAGVATTLPFHRWLLEQEPFVAGDINTRWAEQAWPEHLREKERKS